MRQFDPLDPPLPGDALGSGLWPLGAGRDSNGVMCVAGQDVAELARRFGTPLFILDEDDFRRRCRTWRSAFGSAYSATDIYYAAKAFLCVTVARWVAEEGLGLDVCTGGELASALRADFPPERIAFHGNNKSSAELATALRCGVGRIVLDSFEEIKRLQAIAGPAGIKPTVLIRVTLDVTAPTHDAIATGHADQKFGLSWPQAEQAAVRILRDGILDLIGIHSHIGSQILETGQFLVAAERAIGLLARLRDRRGIELHELNLGGGTGIAYRPEDTPMSVTKLAGELGATVASAASRAGLPSLRLAVEPGRALIGPSMLTLYEVGTVKPVTVPGPQPMVRTYVSVDGGMSDNMRPSLYGAAYTCTLASRTSVAAPMPARLVGKHCEAGDIIIRDLALPGDLTPGDLLAVAATGAYGRSMASNYNLICRPPVAVVAQGQEPRLIVRRENYDDLFATDVLAAAAVLVDRDPEPQSPRSGCSLVLGP